MSPETKLKRKSDTAADADATETWVYVGNDLWERVGSREQAAVERKRRRLARNIIAVNPTNIEVVDLTDDDVNSNQQDNTKIYPKNLSQAANILEDNNNTISTKEILKFQETAYIENVITSEINSLEQASEQPSTSGNSPRNDHVQSVDSSAYLELKELQQSTLILNVEVFECEICMVEYGAGEGIVLHECIHTFCRECLAETIRQCTDPEVPCPSTNCSSVLQDREVRALVPEHDYERWLARGLSIAEGSTKGSFHCRYQDCRGWAICDPEVERFPCPVCDKINCVPCEAIHELETCGEYRANLKEAANGNASQVLIDSLISRGEAMLCPECKVVITKAIGCDWLQCPGCKTEICWITKGRRWGPLGRGDTSGGCRCGVKRKCHPKCGNCH